MVLNLLLDLGIILIAGTILASIFKLLKQPPIIAYLIAGFLIGPIGLKLISNSNDIMLFAELGVAFLLFVVGIETDIKKLLHLKQIIIFGPLLQVLLSGSFIFLFTQFLHYSFLQSLYLAVMLSFGSTVLVVKILSSRNQITTLHGRIIIGLLIVQDILAIIIFPFISNLKGDLMSTAIQTTTSLLILFIIAIVLSKVVFPRLFRAFSDSHEVFFLLVVSICFLFIFISVLLNFSIPVGAFIGGLTLASLRYNFEAVNKIRGIRDFFSTIFFVSLPMQVATIFAISQFPLFALLLITILIINPLIHFLISMFFGFGLRTSVLVALALTQASEFAFIIGSVGLKNNIITQEIFSTVILVIAITMALTPYFMQHSNSIYRQIAKRINHTPRFVKTFYYRVKRFESIDEKELENHLIIVGGGVFGEQIVKALKEHEPILVDHDPLIINDFIEKKFKAIYGEADNEEIWNRINLGQAKALILAIPDFEKTLHLAKLARKQSKKTVIFARCRKYSQALELYENGADFVIMPEIIGSNMFLKNIVDYLKKGKEHLTSLRSEYIQFLKEKISEQVVE